MRKIAFVMMVIALVVPAAFARDLLVEAAGKIAQAPSLSTRFEASDPTGKVTGEAIMAGKRFIIVTDAGDYETWFDGKTQWTYNAAASEVSMTEPTEAEILEVNPLAIISDVDKRYKITSLTSDRPGIAKYKLLPVQSGSPVSSAEVSIDRSTGWPVEIRAVLPDNGTVSLKFRETKAGERIPSERFRYNPAIHPTAEIIDLR